MGVSGLKFMAEVGIGLGIINFILIVVVLVLMALLSGRVKAQGGNITFIFRRAKDEQRRQEQKEDQMLQLTKKNQSRGHRKAGS